jgi:REP element-mobilizing transposase RayT
VSPRHPVHLTLKLDARGQSLRTYTALTAVREVLRSLHMVRSDFRVVAFSLQHNHLHVIAEADEAEAFISGARALCIRLAKRLNEALGRRGRLFSDRYHRRVLATPREVRHALAYVLLNRRRHLAQWGRPLGRAGIDPYSSGLLFDGWARSRRRLIDASEVKPPATWLAQVGWRRHGLLSPAEVPGGTRVARGAPQDAQVPGHRAGGSK